MSEPRPRKPTELRSFDVARVHTANGSYVEPPLQQEWDQATKLAWHASVVAYDTGLDITVATGGMRRKNRRRWWRPRPRWRDVPNVYSIRIDGSTLMHVTYAAAWDYLNGISVGARRGR